MPRTEQIIPSYLHPHVATYINDNSVFEEVVSPAEDGVRMLAVFTSAKGRDGVLLQFDSQPNFIEEYGKPNYKLYGQPCYMPDVALKTQMAKVWCMRVMPEDAAYSNVVIVAKVKVDKTDAANPKLVVKYEAMFHTNLTSKDEFFSLTTLMQDLDPDVDGFITVPLFGNYVLGRGSYGNTFRIRVSAAPEADLDNGFKNYRFEVLDSEGGIARKELFTGSLYPDAVDSGKTIYLEDLINDTDTGSKKLGMYVNENALDIIYQMYKEEVDPDTELTLGTFDIITAKDLNGRSIQNIVIDTTSTNAVALDKVEGIVLAGGDDGSFKVNPSDPSIRETAINNAYIKAFNGEMDKAILSKRRTPAELIFDANYAEEVKRALISLITKRSDVYGFIDAGLLNSATDAIEWAEAFANIGDRLFSKECQHITIKDSYSGKNIPVTITYFLAQQLPNHFKTYGNHVPYQGETYAKLTGIVKGSLKPVIDADDNDVKEALYTKRVNYFECIAENTFVRGTQGTSQTVWSDLSEENNMHVLLEMKRKLEAIVASKIYNYAEKEDRQRFTEQAERLFADYQGTKVREATVYFDMNSFEEERSILHCYLAVTFRTMAKRGVIEIDINKRV